MDPQANKAQDQTPPIQPDGVKVDLLHPQQTPLVPAAPAPAPAPPTSSPVAPVSPQSVSTAPPVASPIYPPVAQASSAPSPAPIATPPSAAHPAASSLPQMPPPLTPTPPVQQIGTTQQPHPTKPASKSKLIIIIAAIIVLLIAAGLAVYLLLLKKPTPPTPVIHSSLQPGPVSNLRQYMGDILLSPGADSTVNKISFNFEFSTKADTGSLIPEVEIEPIDTHFTDKPTISGSSIDASGGTIVSLLTSPELKQGSYHWQARIRIGDKNGPWKAFESIPFSFSISTGAKAPMPHPIVETVDGVKVVDNQARITSSQPLITGTSVAGAAMTVTINPGGIIFQANADNSGAWKAKPTSDLPKGEYIVAVTAKTADGETATSFALSVNPTASAATPTPSSTPTPSPVAEVTASPTPSPVADASPGPTPSATLAPTGDPVVPISLITFAALAASLFGLWSVARRHED